VCDTFVAGGTCRSCRGQQCDEDHPCCGDFECVQTPASGRRCDGCASAGVTCGSGDDCCFSDCVDNSCFSLVGGPCSFDIDCRACYIFSNCNGACVGGVCTA
jgi:hypothetical protein